MIISVASGKGGTGKTTIAVNLALSLKGRQLQLVDCDVEEPNDHIFIKPKKLKKEPVYIPLPQVDDRKCTGCGRCRDICQFNAITLLNKNVLIFQELCHGCGGCAYFCPQKAISETKREIGVVEMGRQGNLDFIQGRLNIGEALSPPVIRAVKDKIDRSKTVIIDAPPGTSCPVIEAVKNTDFCVMVTEPTPFGLNDLILCVEMLRELKINFGVIINRSDIGDSGVEDYCRREEIPVILRIPFDRKIASLYSRGLPIIGNLSGYDDIFSDLYNRIEGMVAG
jgi:MinD superfamily P-loop ATPase